MAQQSLTEKLRLHAYPDKLLLNLPAHVTAFEGITFDSRIAKPDYDLILAFIFSLDEFSALLRQTISDKLLRPDGYLYIAYPKKGNKIYDSHIGRDDFFRQGYVDAEGFVFGSSIRFNRMLAFDDTFTCIGLKNIVTPARKSSAPSQCIADYVDRIPELRNIWSQTDPDILSRYDALTPGYQRDWARYIFSVRTEETRLKRLAHMALALAAGYKSIDLYRRR
ncbi:MAG: YdeI/OmpD-associated family protein [Tannerellaceae bacterium]|jgi:hypothetical protein|nr:YdeI/OmpD-associated family protein [Tannerellaceae bacterium]